MPIEDIFFRHKISQTCGKAYRSNIKRHGYKTFFSLYYMEQIPVQTLYHNHMVCWSIAHHDKLKIYLHVLVKSIFFGLMILRLGLNSNVGWSVEV